MQIEKNLKLEKYSLHNVAGSISDGALANLEHRERGIAGALPLAIETVPVLVGQVLQERVPEEVSDRSEAFGVGRERQRRQDALVEQVEDSLK